MVPAALIQLQLSLFLKEGSRAAGKPGREGGRHGERSHLPPSGVGGGGTEEERRKR